MAQEKFKLPRSSYEELAKIIKAYSSLSQPASLDEITKRSGVGPTVVSSNNAFLASVEMIEGGNKKIATEKGRRVGRALEHNLSDEIVKAWRAVVDGNDFLSKMGLAVRIRKGMEISSLQAHIAYSAGEKKSKGVVTGARSVIEILVNSGLVKEEDDRIMPSAIEAVAERPLAERGRPSRIPAESYQPVEGRPAEVSVHIQVRIEAKPSELEALGEKLNALMARLSARGVRDKKSSGDTERKG